MKRHQERKGKTVDLNVNMRWVSAAPPKSDCEVDFSSCGYMKLIWYLRKKMNGSITWWTIVDAIGGSSAAASWIANCTDFCSSEWNEAIGRIGKGSSLICIYFIGLCFVFSTSSSDLERWVLKEVDVVFHLFNLLIIPTIPLSSLPLGCLEITNVRNIWGSKSFS